jgi:predicted 3-demethylubiquinone-9 3-methyltransferase (glyoxalase superfamily)
MSVTFELDGQEFVALNGGPHFKFTDGISLMEGMPNMKEISIEGLKGADEG